jgi:desampylase
MLVVIIRISRAALDAIHADARACRPNECCGLLLADGAPDKIDHVLQAPNVAATPETRFEIDPQLLVNTYRAQRKGGPKVRGCYHSHPSGDATPSATDASMAGDSGQLWLIVGQGDVPPRLWRVQPGGTVHGMFEPTAMLIE